MTAKKKQAADPLQPSPQLLIKLGSVIVHQEEAMSSKGHHFDMVALQTVREDPEVVAWLKSMTDMGMLPIKR